LGGLLLRRGKGREGKGREEREGEGKERAMNPPTIWRKFTPMVTPLAYIPSANPAGYLGRAL